MSVFLKHYMQDGANYQARAVLAVLQHHDGIESSFKDGQYKAEIYVSRWENCREQGYVVSLRNDNGKQLNIAWFEHRNTDSIHAIKWVQKTINAPTISTADFGDIYKDKPDTSHMVHYGEYNNMAQWIWEQLTNHWESKE